MLQYIDFINEVIKLDITLHRKVSFFLTKIITHKLFMSSIYTVETVSI